MSKIKSRRMNKRYITTNKGFSNVKTSLGHHAGIAIDQDKQTPTNLFIMKTITHQSKTCDSSLLAHQKQNLKRFTIKHVLVVFMMLISALSFAQITETNGNGTVWNTAANWTNGVPTPASTVVIKHTMTAPSAAITIASLSIEDGATLTLVANSITVSGATNVVDGNITDNSTTGNNNFNGLVTVSASGAFTTGTWSQNFFNGGIVNDGSITVSNNFTVANSVSFQNNNVLNLSGALTSGSPLINDGTATFTAATLNAGGTNNGTLTATGILTVGSNQTFTNNGTATVVSALQAANTNSTWVNADGSILNINNTNSPMATPAVGVLNASAVNNTVNYIGGNQTIRNVDYWNLNFSGTGNKTLGGNVNVLNNVNLTSCILLIGANNLNIEGTTSIQSGSFNDAAAAGLTVFNGTVTVSSGGNITASNSPTFEFRNGINTIITGIISGPFNAIFSTNNQSITGVGAITLGSCVVSGAGIELTYDNSATLTITGALNGSDPSSRFIVAPNRTVNYNAAVQPMDVGVLDASSNGCTFAYNGGNQTVKASLIPYYNLTLSNSGAKTFNASETYLINGNFRRLGTATLTLTGSTINMQGPDNAIIEQAGSNALTALFNNLTINKSGGTVTFTVTSSTFAPSVNNLTVSSGVLQLGNTALTLTVANQLAGASGTLNASGAAHILVLNSANNSIFNFVGGTSSTVRYAGGDQTIFASANYNNIQVQGTGIKSLSGGLRCIGTFNFNANVFVALGNNNLKLAPSASLTSSGPFGITRMFLTDGEGFLIKEGNSIAQLTSSMFPSTIFSIANTSVYPVGNSGSPNLYTPFYILGGNLSATLSLDPYISVRAVPNRQPNVPYFNNALIKYWDIEAVNLSAISADVAFTYVNPTEVVGSNNSNYQIRVYNPVSSSLVTPNNPLGTGTVNIRSTGNNFLTGQWTAIDPTINTTIYSYQSGDWENLNTWTTDASGTTLIAPPNVPTNGDNVVILNGRTVTTTVVRSIASLVIEGNGVLDLGTVTGHNLGIVNGQGKLRLSSTTFPAGTYTNFVSSTGGTVEYYNLSGTVVLPTTQTSYNNLLLTNSSSNSYVARYNSATTTVNGNFELTKTGTGTVNFQFGNGSGGRTLNVQGDVFVGTENTISVYSTPNGNNHTFNVFKNMTIDGVVNLTNVGQYVNSGGSGLGTCLIHFRGNTENTSLTCNAGSNVTFHQFQVTKNEGFELYASSSASSTVRFWGGDGTIIINLGTLRLGPNIQIDRLNNGGNYDIGSDGILPVLWIDGATVYAGTTTAVVLYGTLKVSAGLFDAGSIGQTNTGSQNSIVPRESGTMEISGGTVNCRMFRVSNTSNLHRGAYIQTGGTFNATSNYGSGTITGVPPFSLVYPDNVFIMTGGVLNIENNGGSSNGFIINSSPQNVEVTGGTINFRVNSNNTFGISSTAPLFDVNIIRVSGTGVHQLGSFGWNLTGSGGSGTSPARPLIVKGNLNLVQGVQNPVFNGNNIDVEVQGLMNVQVGTNFNAGSGNLILSGTANQTLLLNGGFNPGSIIISKPGTEVFIDGGLSSFQASGGLNITSGILNDNGKILNFRGNIVNNGTCIGTGKIVLNGNTNSQNIGGSGSYNNVDFANSNGSLGSAQVFASSNIQINGNINVTTDRLVNLQNFRMQISASSNLVGPFGQNRHFRTNGLLSDGGIAKPFNNLNAFIYPFGTAVAGYTPATIKFNSAPSAYGTIDVRPVTTRQLYVTSSDCFEYYWKVKTTGTSGVVPNSMQLTFNYGNLTDNLAYIPAYYNFTNIAYQTINDVSKVVEASKNILFENWTDLNGDFTAGAPSAFGVVVPFYSRTNGAWENPNTWSNASHTGPAASSVPDGNKPVFIGLNHIINVNNNNTQSGSLIIESSATLDLGTSTGHNFGALPFATAGGAGRLRISSNTPTAQFPAGDFGLFFTPDGGTTEFYSLSGGVDFLIPGTSIAPTNLNINTFNNLIISPGSGRLISFPNKNLEIYNNLTTSGLGRAYLNQANPRTIIVNGLVNLTSGGLLFGSIANQELDLRNDVNISSSSFIEVDNVGSANHKMKFVKSLINNGTLSLNQASKVNLEFISTNNSLFTGSNNFATNSLASLTLNKGVGINTSLTLDVAGSLTTPSNGWLGLQNGTLRFNKDASITISDQASTFLIPGTTKLEINNPLAVINVAMGNSGLSDLVLEGAIEIINGTMNVGNNANNQHNDFAYAPTGVPSLILRNNSQLNINGQLRRSVAAFAGSLDYQQYNNSTVLVRGKNPDASGSLNLNRAKFEILNPGSNFVMANTSSLIIDRNGQPSGIFGDILINPASSNISGGEIIIGTANTVSGTSNFTSNIIPTLNNLTIDGNVTDKTFNLGGNPLSLNGNLRINGNSIFRANGQNVTIFGNLINLNSNTSSGLNTGGFQPGTSTQITTFNSNSSNQSITGNSVPSNNLTNFANLVINNTFASGSLNVNANSNVRVNNNLNVLSGNLSTGANNVDVVGNVIINTIHSSVGTGRVALIGSNQTIGGNGNGQFGNLRLNSGSGSEVILTAPLRVNGTITFVTGNLYLNNHLLTLGTNAVIAGSFSTNSMIRLNGVLSDGGVRKLYPPSAQDFSFPIGVTLKYTPVRMNVTANSATGDITVKPINSKHPATTDVTNSELAYYWNVASNGFTAGTTVNQTFNYLDVDVNGVEADYRTGRYINNVWTPQFGVPSSVNAGLNQMQLNGVNYFDGDYTAGIQTEFDQLLVYYSRNATLGGNWNNVNTWSTDQALQHAGPPCATPPAFNSVIIAAGHTVIGNINNLSSPTAIVNGTLNLNNTFGHNFGTVSGTGTLRMSPNGLGNFIFPAGNYSSFTSTGGGTVEYFSGGSSNLPSQSTYNNIVFSGIGTKSLFNTDYIINGNLIIDAGIVTNVNDKNITLFGNFNNLAGPNAFVPGNGQFSLNGVNQLLSGSAINFYRLNVNNGGNKTLDGITISISNQLNLNNGKIATGAGTVSIQNSANVIGASVNSYVNGNLQRFISTGTISRTFQIGDDNQYTPATVNFLGTTNNTGSFTMFTSTGDHPSSGTSGLNPSKSVNRYWTLINGGVSGFTSYNLTLNFPNADIDGAANPLLFRVKRFSGGVWNLTTSGTMAANSSQANGLTPSQTGDFYIAEELVAGLTWTGAVDTDWNNAGNWLPNFVPSSSDDVTIPFVTNQPSFLTGSLVGNANNVILASNSSINVPAGYTLNIFGNLTSVNNQITGGGTVRFFSPSANLTGSSTFFGVVSIASGSTLNTNNGLTLANNASLMHGTGTAGAGGNVIGNVNVRRSGSPSFGNYNYWSSPITSASINAIGSSNRFLYDPNSATGITIPQLQQGWQPVTSGLMTVGRGYISTGAGTVSFNGTPNNGSFTYGPLVIGSFSEFNLVGNPYPSGMKATDFVAANPQIIGGALYFWDDDGSQGPGYSPADYGTWNVIGFVGPNSGQPFNGNIASCQSFFVRAANTTPINYSNSMRTTVNNEFFDVLPIGRVWLSITDANNKYNETLIAFKSDATDGFDLQYDAAKFKTPNNIVFYSKIGNEDYAIQALGELNSDKQIPLGIETPTSGNQTIALKNTENFDGTSQVILEDIKLGIFHNLKNSEYSYQFDASVDVNRFRLHFKPAVTVTTTAESCVQNDATLTIQSPSNSSWNYEVKNAENLTVAMGNNFTGSVEVPHLSGGNYTINLNNVFGSLVTIPVSIAAGSPVSASITASSTTVEANNNYVTFEAQVNGATDFTWNFGDGTIVSGATNPSHVYTQPGTYEVTFIASNAYCIDSKSITIVVKSANPLSVNQVESKASFALYPNPVLDIANVQLNMPQNEDKLVVYILDGAGKLVKTENFNRIDKKSTIQLNVSELANGIYQIMIQGKHFSANAKLDIIR